MAFHKAFIDVVRWTPSSSDVYAYRFPETNLSSGAQVIVDETQEAIFKSNGKWLDVLGPGKHSLQTANIPLLRDLWGIPFGGKNPFTAEIWFVNKVAPLTIDWQTTPVRYMDPDYGQMVLINAKGRYGLKVVDSAKFLGKLVGTVPAYDTDQLTNHFLGPLISKTNSCLLSFMNANAVGITQIAAYLDQLSNFIKEPLTEFWNEYGMEMTGFYITSVDLDTSTEDGKKIASALSDRSAQNIAGYTWQQRQGFETVNNAVANSRGGLGMIGAAMMMGGGFGGGGNAVGSQMMNPTQQAQSRAPGAGMNSGSLGAKEVFCSKCGKKYPNTSRFCPSCGDPFNPCPTCGADNAEGAKRCAVCGSSLASVNQISDMLQQNACPRCKATAAPGTKFCPNCGCKIL